MLGQFVQYVVIMPIIIGSWCALGIYAGLVGSTIVRYNNLDDSENRDHFVAVTTFLVLCFFGPFCWAYVGALITEYPEGYRYFKKYGLYSKENFEKVRKEALSHRLY